MRDAASGELLGKLRAWRDTINKNFTDVFNELRYIIAREDEPVAYSTAAQNSDTDTLADDDELYVPVKANARYELRMSLTVLQTAADVGLAFAWTVPTGTTIRAQVSHAADRVTQTTEAGGSITGANLNGNSTADVEIEIVGSVTVGTTKGAVRFQFAQQSASASVVSRRASSYMRLDRLDR